MLRLLIGIICFFSLSFSMKLGPLLNMLLSGKKEVSTTMLALTELDEIKVLYKDGSIEVLPFSDLETLMRDNSVLYIEAPRKLKPLMEVVRNSSIAIVGSGNESFSVRVRDGQRLKLKKFGNGSVSFNGNCSGSLTDMVCSEGKVNFEVNATGNYRLIVISNNKSLKVSDVEDAIAFYVGTSASLFDKTGRGVIIAVIDTGINPCHPAFINPNGTSRILLFYEPKTGRELTQSDINDSINNNRCNFDNGGHGTHVAGIAAGSDPNTPYKGIATEAELIVIKLIDFNDTEIIKALDYLVQKLNSIGKPIVVNMSLGGHFGPHDGTGLLSRAVDNAVDSGLIIVTAAGNEGNLKIHAQVENLSSETYINIQTLTPGGDAIDGWYTGGSSLEVSLCKGGTCISASPGAISSGNIGGCNVYIDNSVTSSPLNGDGEFFVAYDCSNSFTLKLKPLSGVVNRVDMYFVCPFCISEFKDHVPYDSLGGVAGTVGIPGVAKKAITVGAITSKPIPGPSEVNVRSMEDLGKIAFFSSRGPTRDGRIKPDVVAGGLFVFSALNDGSSYGPNAGTSMAAPVVSGLIALLLEGANTSAGMGPYQLDPDKVKEELLSYAVADASTGSLPNNIYGHGKVVLDKEGISETPISSGGGGGCTTSSSNYVTVLMLTVTFLLLKKRIQRRR